MHLRWAPRGASIIIDTPPCYAEVPQMAVPALKSRSRLTRLIALAAATVAGVAVAAAVPSQAFAHGNIVDAPSRNFGCWQRWGSKFQDPTMATADPMCYQAWQANPNTMWNWMSLYRNGM